jgi:hypothetical protein
MWPFDAIEKAPYGAFPVAHRSRYRFADANQSTVAEHLLNELIAEPLDATNTPTSIGNADTEIFVNLKIDSR